MINNKSEFCTGCGACVAICPKNCISFIRNEDGFDVPTINYEQCIKCGRCTTVCSALADKIEGVADETQIVFAAVSKNIDLWESSTSGGAFTEICKAVKKIAEDSDIIFCGAGFEGLQVNHSCVSELNKVAKFRKSKYIQSNTQNCFREIKLALKTGSYVVFSGTPCQVYGLRKFLGQSYDNLYCIDLICHGVGSPGVFEKSIEEAEQTFGKKIQSYTFRSKKRSNLIPITRYTSLYIFEDGTKKRISYDDYNRLFISQNCLRSSCSANCRFRNRNRQGDFTIADFNEKMHAFPELKDEKNYSTIVFNNEKAKKLIQVLADSMKMYECDIEHICRFNPLFCKNTEGATDRSSFFEAFRSGKSIRELAKTYGAKPPKGLQAVANCIPYRLKRIIYKMLNKI